VSGGRQEVLQSGIEDLEAKHLFNSTFKGKYSIFMSKVCSLGAFAKLRQATVSFVMSIRPPVRPFAWNSLAPTGQIFIKFAI